MLLTGKVALYRATDNRRVFIDIPAVADDDDDFARKQALERVSNLQAKKYIIVSFLADSYSGHVKPICIEPQFQSGEMAMRLLAVKRRSGEKSFLGQPRYYTEEAWAAISDEQKKAMRVDETVARKESAIPMSADQKAEAALTIAQLAAENAKLKAAAESTPAPDPKAKKS